MKSTEFHTALIMVLIPLSFFFWLVALNQTDEFRIVFLAILGLITLLMSIALWLEVESRIKREETEEHKKRIGERADMQTLIREMKGLRQDIKVKLPNQSQK